jgi:methylated-DNA-[protein]-cysteine S-methyltransferase
MLAPDRIDSSIGDVLVVCDGDAICAFEFSEHQDRMNKLLPMRYNGSHYVEQDDPVGTSSRVRTYLCGKLDAVATIKVSLDGTDRQQRVRYGQ